MFLLNILWSLLDFGKCLSMRCRKILPMFVCTLLLNGGLNQIICLFLVLVRGWLFGWWIEYERSDGCPLSLRAFWYSILVSSNICSLEEFSDSRLHMDFLFLHCTFINRLLFHIISMEYILL